MISKYVTYACWDRWGGNLSLGHHPHNVWFVCNLKCLTPFKQKRKKEKREREREREREKETSSFNNTTYNFSFFYGSRLQYQSQITPQCKVCNWKLIMSMRFSIRHIYFCNPEKNLPPNPPHPQKKTPSNLTGHENL